MTHYFIRVNTSGSLSWTGIQISVLKLQGRLAAENIKKN